MRVEAWRVVLTLHKTTGQVSVRAVGGDPAYARVRVSWAEGMRRAVDLAGPGETIRVRVVVPAVSGTYKTVNVYRLQLPRDKETRKAARGGKDSAA